MLQQESSVNIPINSERALFSDILPPGHSATTAYALFFPKPALRLSSLRSEMLPVVVLSSIKDLPSPIFPESLPDSLLCLMDVGKSEVIFPRVVLPETAAEGSSGRTQVMLQLELTAFRIGADAIEQYAAVGSSAANFSL